MITEKERDGRKSVVVVLDRITEKSSLALAPLRYAFREIVRQNNEVLVLAILISEEADELPISSNATVAVGDGGWLGNGDSYIKFLNEEVDQRKEAFTLIFWPYYDRCKSSGVKFQVKISNSFQPQALVVEEANNVNATWIVMDRCFARDQSLQMNGTQWNVAMVSGDEDIVAYTNLPCLKDVEETSIVQELRRTYPKSSKLHKGIVLTEDYSHIQHASPNFESKYWSFFPSLTSTSRIGESSSSSSNKSKSLRKVDNNTTSTGFSKVNLVTRTPLQLSWALVEEITSGFAKMYCMEDNENYKSYWGFLSDHHSKVLVKLFTGQFDYVLEAEKRAALSMYHKNILGLIGYHNSKKTLVLVYPFTWSRTLDMFNNGPNGSQFKLTFKEKLKIAIGIGQGIRYMHEECPRGPIVHGDLRPCNIFLKFDLEPLITGFGQAKWLQQKQDSPMSRHSRSKKDPKDLESMALLKTDIFHFGIMLLRLFCRRSAPQDDKNLIDWARPFLQKGAYHELLDEDMNSDVYDILRVISAAAQCIEPKLISRPSISEVIYILKGETSCALQQSPSSEGSPNIDFSLRLS